MIGRARVVRLTVGRASQLQAKRTVFPVIAAGVAMAVVGGVVKYGVRAYKRIQEEDALGGGGGGGGQEEGAADSSSSDNPKARGEAIARVLGIDLGTAFSKVAVHDEEARSVTVCESKDGRRSVAASVFRHSAEEDLQPGHLARAARFVKPGNTAHAFTPLLNAEESNNIVRIDGAEYLVDDLCTRLAANLLSAADNKLDKGASSVAIIAAPNNFSYEANERLIAAVRKAGVDAIGTIPDGIASVIGSAKVLGPTRGHVVSSDSGSPVTVAVVDVGGACTQLCLVTVDGPNYSLVNSVTVDGIGGEAFDALLASYLAAEFSKHNSGLDLLQDAQAKQRVFDAAESAKHDLSTNKSTEVKVPFISATQRGPLHLNVTLSRSQLDRVLSAPMLKIKAEFKNLLFSGGATAPLKSVLLCGGGARMPAFTAMVQEVTGGLEAVVVPAPEEVAAIGAAASLEQMG